MRRKLRRIVSSEPKPQRWEMRFTGKRDSDNSRRAASTLRRSMARAGGYSRSLGIVPAETAFTHPGLIGQHTERKLVGQMLVDPFVQRAEFVLGRLHRQCLAELRLPARALEEDNEIACHRKCDDTTQILFYQRQRQVRCRPLRLPKSRGNHHGKADAAELRQALCKRGKTDPIDAAAICEAVTRPSMSFVPVKGVEQQGLSMLHSARSQLVGQRTQLINAARGHLSEFGIVAARGLLGFAELTAIVRDESDQRLPVTARVALINDRWRGTRHKASRVAEVLMA